MTRTFISFLPSSWTRVTCLTRIKGLTCSRYHNCSFTPPKLVQWWIIDMAAGLHSVITCKETWHHTRVRAAREDGETMERGGWWWRRLSVRMKKFKKKKKNYKGEHFQQEPMFVLKGIPAKMKSLFSNAIKWLSVHSRSLLVLRPQTDWKDAILWRFSRCNPHHGS